MKEPLLWENYDPWGTTRDSRELQDDIELAVDFCFAIPMEERLGHYSEWYEGPAVTVMAEYGLKTKKLETLTEVIHWRET